MPTPHVVPRDILPTSGELVRGGHLKEDVVDPLRFIVLPVFLS
jgi:hypothetical protein